MSHLEALNDKLVEREMIKAHIQRARENGQTIVFTNGCFDIIHKGHIKLLSEAAAQGNHLVLGLNSDESVKRLKGEGRPVNNQNDRALILSAMSMVDTVVHFTEDTPLELIGEILPDVLVKGADYSEEEVVGAEQVKANGGRVHLVNLVDGYSSSNYIDGQS